MFYSGICLDGPKKANRNVSQDSRCLGAIQTEHHKNTILERRRYTTLLCITYHYGGKMKKMRKAGQVM
jgi:uncharacterized protein YqiB (DUF1249 family)